jgi:hypothetical protein
MNNLSHKKITATKLEENADFCTESQRAKESDIEKL